MAPSKRLVATTSFASEVKGTTYIVGAGELVTSNHPAAKAHPELFREEFAVETATAAPGEVR